MCEKHLKKSDINENDHQVIQNGKLVWQVSDRKFFFSFLQIFKLSKINNLKTVIKGYVYF